MSGINSLPGGGKDFSTSRFTSKLKYLSKRKLDLIPLSDNQEAITKAVKRYQKDIRQGSFDKSRQSRAVNQIKAAGNVNASQLKTIKKIVDKLGEGGKDAIKSKVKINMAKAEQGELSGPRLSQATKVNKGSGLSDISSPKDYKSALTNRPLTSISQRKEFGRGAGVATPDRANDRGLSSPPSNSPGPSIPLSR